MKKPRFTMEQHEKMAKELLFLRNRIIQVSKAIDKAYPSSLGICDQGLKARQNIDEMRNRLDAEVKRENSSINNRTDSFYWPSTAERTPAYEDSEISSILTK